MLSVFRITRAEFAKVFKKPTVYIMAFILAIVLVIGLVTYNPVVKGSKSVSVDGDNAGTVYSVFMSSSETSDTKTKLDNLYINATNNKILFYDSIYTREANISKHLESLKTNYNLLASKFASEPTSTLLPDMLAKCKTDITNLMNAYADFSAFSNYENLTNIINYKNSALQSSAYYEATSFDIKEGEKNYTYRTLSSTWVPTLTSESTTTEAFVNYFKVNGFLEIFENMANYGNNIVYNTLNSFIADISKTKDSIIQLVFSGSMSENTKITIIGKITLLKETVSTFKSLVDGLSTNSVIYSVHTNAEYEKLTQAYDGFINMSKSVDLNDVTEMTSKSKFASALRGSDFVNKFQDYVNNIHFIELDSAFIERTKSYQKTAETNQSNILKEITKYRTETSTSNIIDEITNYMLLGETYTNIIDNEVLNQYSNTLSLSTMKDARNIDLKSYNDYNNKHTISQLLYQLNNNIYSNKVGSTFSLNQTISTKESMFDFTYYSLKLCTILIIIFTVMMIANLITSETDSGTIKLLLIRPYRRSTILFGKILATFFFSLSFLFFSFIVSMVAGYFMFGLPSVSQVLVTFNASKTFLIKPILLILIHFLSCAGDILFYLLIALTVSVLFRSYIGAISTSLIIYVGSIVVGALLSNSVVFAYLPFTNISWFRFFGGEILPSSAGINAILSSPVHSFQNIWLSMGISIGFSLILSIITFVSFKRRDF